MKNKSLKKKSQASVEYIILFTIVAAIILPMSFYFLRTVEGEEISNLNDQFYRIGLRLISVIEDVYYKGYPTKITYEENFPGMLLDINSSKDGSWYVITFVTERNHEIPVITKVPVEVKTSGVINEGVKKISVLTEKNDDSIIVVVQII